MVQGGIRDVEMEDVDVDEDGDLGAAGANGHEDAAGGGMDVDADKPSAKSARNGTYLKASLLMSAHADR